MILKEREGIPFYYLSLAGLKQRKNLKLVNLENKATKCLQI